ncbi:hypothetical protein [Halobacterium sp. CBA1126]|uniref:hypothetical protein n=1 Tax=Halobacterium sp. CBA1126 TaxID=2668074 RepID=UPI0012FC644F|nr:hypothetical protein [Halobacterium sp. CBA1126]MUV59807.1 hypothetical protein [Halobacterium sp. CBA1126]
MPEGDGRAITRSVNSHRKVRSDGTLVVVKTVYYQVREEQTGYCPFCESADGVEATDDVMLEDGGEQTKYRCECGASGANTWEWRAGQIEEEVSDGGE